MYRYIKLQKGVWVEPVCVFNLICPLSNTSKVGGGPGKEITRNGEI